VGKDSIWQAVGKEQLAIGNKQKAIGILCFNTGDLI
jgi:hypothetical protein